MGSYYKHQAEDDAPRWRAIASSLVTPSTFPSLRALRVKETRKGGWPDVSENVVAQLNALYLEPSSRGPLDGSNVPASYYSGRAAVLFRADAGMPNALDRRIEYAHYRRAVIFYRAASIASMNGVEVRWFPERDAETSVTEPYWVLPEFREYLRERERRGATSVGK
ncbi:hypothetical protein JCM10450v2_008339 [Rhodotorula kratochvilovae]